MIPARTLTMSARGHYRHGIDAPPDRVDPPAHHRLVVALLTALMVVGGVGLVYAAVRADDTPPRPTPTTNPVAPDARSVPTASTSVGTRLLINWSPPASCGGVRELAWWIDDYPGNSAPASRYDLDEFVVGALRDRWADLGCAGKFPTD